MTCLTFLGIEIDSVAWQIRLPKKELEGLLSTVQVWMRGSNQPIPRYSSTKRELLSLVGLLSHVASVVHPGRAFLWSLIDAASSVKELEYRVHLNFAARADIAWWYTFIRIWNVVSILQLSMVSLPLISDASGCWGLGVIHGNLWFQVQWPPHWYDHCIAAKELITIVMAVALWGPYWAGKRVVGLCDNSAVVAAVNKGSARDPSLSHLLRTLAFLVAVLDISLSACHIPGSENISADALSRDIACLFLSLNPQASPISTIIPPELLELVFNQALHWTSLG